MATTTAATAPKVLPGRPPGPKGRFLLCQLGDTGCRPARIYSFCSGARNAIPDFSPSRNDSTPNWRDDPVRSGKIPRFAYFPFGGGPRGCVGAAFAMMEATLLLAMIQQKYHLEVVPGHPIEIFASVTLRPKHGIRVIPQRRTADTK